MSNWIYPDAIKRIERACAAFLAEQIDVKGLQAALYQSEQEIEAVEEKWLRSLLFDAENKLEEITYTVSSGQRKVAMLTVVEKLLSDLQSNRGRGTKR